jgi:predicted ATPase
MVFWQLLGEAQLVDEHAGQLRSLAEELRAAYWLAIATTYRGWALAARGEPAAAVPMIRDGLATFRATSATYLLPHYLAILAAALRLAGEPEQALLVLAEAAARRTGERWSLAEIHRLEGEIRAALPAVDRAMAEAPLLAAIELAQTQAAHGWELRAATSLARLWAAWGARWKAHGLLAPAYGWFTEGFDTSDLRGARALLDELQ